MIDHIRALRPHQWTKNAFVFAAPVFARKLTDGPTVMRSLAVFVAFSAVASAVYLLNDAADYERDRAHPKKKHRPIAAGKVSRTTALVLAAIIGPAGVGLAWWLNPATAVVLAVYLGVNLLYSTRLKHIVLIDVFIIALGFLLRVTAGATAIAVGISTWLILCTFFVALLIAFGKRRGELTLLGADAADHRGILGEYDIAFLDTAIAALAAMTTMSYALYAIDPLVMARLHTDALVLTLPPVVFGIFRWMHISHTTDEAASPTRLLLTDRGLQTTALIYVALVVGLIYFEVNLGLLAPQR